MAGTVQGSGSPCLILKGLRPCIKNFAHNLNSLDLFPISFLYFLIFLSKYSKILLFLDFSGENILAVGV